MTAVVFNGNLITTHGVNSDNARFLATSTDGLTWTLQPGLLGQTTDLNKPGTDAKGVAVITLPKGVGKGVRKAVASVSGMQSASVKIRTT